MFPSRPSDADVKSNMGEKLENWLDDYTEKTEHGKSPARHVVAGLQRGRQAADFGGVLEGAKTGQVDLDFGDVPEATWPELQVSDERFSSTLQKQFLDAQRAVSLFAAWVDQDTVEGSFRRIEFLNEEDPAGGAMEKPGGDERIVSAEGSS